MQLALWSGMISKALSSALCSTSLLGVALFNASCVGIVGDDLGEDFAEGTPIDSIHVARIQLGPDPSDFVIGDVAIHGDMFIYQGDMILAKEQVTFIQSADDLAAFDEVSDGQINGHIDSRAQRWTSGTIPYVIDRGLSAASVQAIETAMEHWQSKTSIEFVEKKSSHPDWVRFVAGDGCASHVGRLGEEQEVSLNLECVSSGTVIHEIGHVVGLRHEHTRSDRDENIVVHWDNIIADQEHNFTIYSSGTNVGDYDFGSIMHYGSHYFSGNGEATLTFAPTVGGFFGQTISLSRGDVAAVQEMYDAPPAPAYIRADIISPTRVRFDWGTVPDADRYNFQITSKAHGADRILHTPQTHYTYYILEPSTKYTFIVSSEKDGVESAKKTLTIVTPRAEDSQTPHGPLAPTGLKSDTYSKRSLELFWDRPPKVVARYEIKRGGRVVGSTNGVSFYESGRKQGSSYLYEVTAIDSNGGRSAPSKILAQTNK